MDNEIFEARGSFDVHVYIEHDAIDNETGALDLNKIYLFAKPSLDVRLLDVTATISTIGTGRFVGTLTAHMGPMNKGQCNTYRGVSCDRAPLNMVAGAGEKLEASVTVVYVAAIAVKVVPVESYPQSK